MSGMFGEKDQPEEKYYSKLSLDPSTLIDPLDLLLEKNSQARRVHSQLMEIFQNETLFPNTNGKEPKNPFFQAIGVMTLLWEDFIKIFGFTFKIFQLFSIKREYLTFL